MAEPVGFVPGRLHLFHREGCQGYHGETAIVSLIAEVGQLSYLPQEGVFTNLDSNVCG